VSAAEPRKGGVSGPAGALALTGTRFLALLLDLALLTLVMALAPESIEPARFAAFLGIAFLYFGGLPLTRLQGTLGKWICRIRLCDRAGRPLGWQRSGLRAAATLAWWCVPLLLAQAGAVGRSAAGVFWVVFFLPWASAGFMPRRESLFDLIAGTLVARMKAEPQSVAEAPPQSPRLLRVVAAVTPCVLVGYVLSTFVGVNLERNLRARVGYAVEQTRPLQERLADYHSHKQRWPSPTALGVPEWTPYRDGGGYRLKGDGVIEISFSVLPELKGHTVTLRPTIAAPGDAPRWRCSSDVGFARMLPAACRE